MRKGKELPCGAQAFGIVCVVFQEPQDLQESRLGFARRKEGRAWRGLVAVGGRRAELLQRVPHGAEDTGGKGAAVPGSQKLHKNAWSPGCQLV